MRYFMKSNTASNKYMDICTTSKPMRVMILSPENCDQIMANTLRKLIITKIKLFLKYS